MSFQHPRGGVSLLTVVVLVAALLLMVGLMLFLTERTELQRMETVRHDGPNVVLIVMDAFRADRIGAERNGERLTPFLDALAVEAMVFDNAVAPCTWTRPSMASAFTSLYVDTHQVYYGNMVEESNATLSDVLPESLPTIATQLNAAGYHTIAIQANGNLSQEFGFHNGFDYYETFHSMRGTEATAHAFEQLETVTSPFFLYVHYMDTHLPFEPPESYREMMGFSPEAIDEEELKVVFNFLDYLYDHLFYITGRRPVRTIPPLSPAGRDAVLALYDAEARYTDDQVKKLVSEIRDRWPDTVFVIASDHGESFWEHDYLGHGLTLFDDELRVPLYLLGPGIDPGRIGTPVDLIDLGPTLLQLLELPIPDSWRGRNILDEALDERPVFSRTYGGSPAWKVDLEMVVASGMKLILNNKDNSVALYNWQEDPNEEIDLSETLTETVATLRELLAKHRRDTISARRTLREQTVLDPETVEQLRRLGYVN